MHLNVTLINWLSKYYPSNSFTKGAISNKYQLVYREVLSSNTITDAQVQELIYPDTKGSDSKYRMFKSRLNSKLLDEILAMSSSDFNNPLYKQSKTKKSTYHCYKNYMVATLIRNFNVSVFETRIILERTLVKTLKLELWNLSLLLAKDLKYFYGVLNINKVKFKKYKSEYERVKTIFNLHEGAEDIYSQIQMYVREKNTRRDPEVLSIIKQQLSKNIQKSLQYNSYYINFLNFNSEFIIANIEKSKEEPLVINRALKYFEKKLKFREIGYVFFLLRKGVYELQNANILKAKIIFEKFEDLRISPTSFTWLHSKYYLNLCLVLTRDYYSCMQNINAYIKHKEFLKFNKFQTQTWYFMEGYVHLLYHFENKTEKSPEGIRPFRIKRFLNETEEMTKEKDGLNVQSYLIQILHLIFSKDYESLESRLNTLKQYSKRNLKKSIYRRTNLFVSLLHKVSKYSHSSKLLIKKAEKLLLKLEAEPFVAKDENLKIELVPYEQLWGAVVKFHS